MIGWTSYLVSPRLTSSRWAAAALSISLALFGCGSPSARQRSEMALRDYQQALAARDVEQLARVWRMSADDERQTRELFDSTQQLSVVLSAPRVTEETGGIVIEFTQTLKTDSGTVGPVAMRARLRDEAGNWKLAEVRPIEEGRRATAVTVADEGAAPPPGVAQEAPPEIRAPENTEAPGTPSAPAPSSPTRAQPARPHAPLDKGATAERAAQPESKPPGAGLLAAQPAAPSRKARVGQTAAKNTQGSGTRSASSEEEDAALAALTEYQAAYERRDLPRLAGVWKMDPFEYELMEQIFRGSDSLKVSIQEQGIAAVGDEIAVDFDQAVARTSVRRARVKLRGSLIRRPGGEWAIVTIQPRDTPTAGDGSTTPGASTPLNPSDSNDSETKAVLAVLGEYERAFEAHDLEHLQHVWILNPLERRSIQELFSEPAVGRVRVRATSIVAADGKATVDFEQSFESPTGAESSQALAVESLRARLARAPDGTLVIVSISNRR